MIAYEPLLDFVLLKRIDEAADLSPGGMVIPDIAKTKSNQGRVIAVGEGRVIGGQIVPMRIHEGDLVLFSKYGAEEITLDGQDFLLVRQDEIKLRQRRVVG